MLGCNTLRQDLRSLVQALDHSGFETKTFLGAGSDRGSGSSENSRQQHPQQRDSHQQPQQHHQPSRERRQETLAWRKTLEALS